MKKKLVLIFGIVCLILAISVGTYSYWKKATDDKNIVFQTGSELDNYIEYDSGESKFVGDLTVSESYLDGVHTTVSIKKTDDAKDLDLLATINMRIAEIGYYMSSTNVLKWAITSGDSENPGSIINQGNFLGYSEEDTITLAPYIEVSTTKQEYTVWIWLDGNEDVPDKITGETIDARIWTYVEQSYEKKFEIDSLRASGSIINSSVINSTSEIVEYAITTTSEEPTEWIQTNANSNIFNLEHEVTEVGTYYVWFKDSDGDIIYDTVSVVNINNGPMFMSITSSTEYDINNFVSFTAASGTSPIVGYNITTSNSQPGVWIPVVSAVEDTTETKYLYDASWARVFHHNSHYGVVLYADEAEAKSSNTVDKYSVLGNLSNYVNASGKYEFLLEYPEHSGYNRWTQSSNPVTNTETVTDYVAIGTPTWTDYGFGGLALSDSGSTLLDGTTQENKWHYAIGAYKSWRGGFPLTSVPVSNVNLWTRVDDKVNVGRSGELTRRIGGLTENQTYYVWLKDQDGNIVSNSVVVSKVDTDAPNNLAITPNYSNIATISFADNVGVNKYYFGTSNPESANVTYTSIDATTNGNITGQTINSGGTYYLAVQDIAGNRSVINTSAYTISYNANGGSGAPSSQSKFVGAILTLSDTKPTRTGYTFAGWNTAADGSGTNYAVGASYTADANVTLYAKWTINKVNINFNVNGGTITPDTGGNTWTTDGDGTAILNGSVYVESINYGASDGSNGLINWNGSSMNITRTGYTAVSGSEWKCLSGCTTSGKTFSHSTVYSASDFCNAANGDCTVELGVNWVANTYKLVLDAGSGTIPSTSGYTNYTDHAVKNITYGSAYGTLPNPTRSGYSFGGWWSTISPGTFTLSANASDNWNYANVLSNIYPGVTYTVKIASATLTSGSTTQFQARVYDFTTNTSLAIVNSSFGSNVTFNITCPSSATAGNDIRLILYSGLGGSTAGIGTKYTTVTIGTMGNTTSTQYTSSSTVATARNHTLFAKWATSSYTVSYNANGGSWTGTAPSNQIKPHGTNITLTSAIPKRSGYVFKGWSTSSSASSATYGSGATYSANASATLYAVWGQCSATYYKNCPTAVMCYSGGQTTVYSRSGFSGYEGYLKVSKSSYPDSAANAVYLISTGSRESTLVMVLQSYCNGLASWYNDSRTGCASGDISSSGFNPVTTYGEAAYVGYMDNVCIANNGQCGSCASGGSASGQTRSCFRCTLNGTAWYQWGYDASMSGSLSGASCQKVGTTGVGCD